MIDAVIGRAFRNNGVFDGPNNMPLSELFERSPIPDFAAMTDEQLVDLACRQSLHVPETAGREQIVELLRDAEDANWEAQGLGMRRALTYIFAGGPKPLDVLQRCYGLAKALNPELVYNMSCEDIAILSGDEGRATVSARIKRLYNEPVSKAGMKGSFLHFQKDSSAVAAYQKAQSGNQNRRGKKFNERYKNKAAKKAA